ncbi:hypothetical protein P9J64_00590 [Deltaproteobacteria bacterium IMCC39524]|nr:hypothetical protein [Deltaproteobacteria bacterium IMCC39524]
MKNKKLGCHENEVPQVVKPDEQLVDEERRAAMKKYAKYTVGTAVGVLLLMSPQTSAVAASDGGPFGPSQFFYPDGTPKQFNPDGTPKLPY